MQQIRQGGENESYSGMYVAEGKGTVEAICGDSLPTVCHSQILSDLLLQCLLSGHWDN